MFTWHQDVVSFVWAISSRRFLQVSLHGWRPGDHLQLFSFLFHLEPPAKVEQTMQQMPTVVADKQQWQQNHPSRRKRYLKCCRLTSKHERVKVAERVWAHSRGHSASDRNTCTGREERKMFNPPNVRSDLKSLSHEKWSVWKVEGRPLAFIWSNKEQKWESSDGTVGSASLLFPTFFLQRLLQHLHALSALRSTRFYLLLRGTQAKRGVAACARARVAGRSWRRTQITHSRAKFYLTT